MGRHTLNILIVEEDAANFVLLNSYINKFFQNPVIVYSQFLTKAVEINSSVAFDVLIISLKFEQTSEKELFNKLLKKANHPAVIILTDHPNETLATEAILAGAQDVIAKENLNSSILYKSITHAVARRIKNLEVATAGQQYKNLFNRNPLPVLVYEVDNKKLLLTNEAAEHFYGYTWVEFAAMTIFDLQQKTEAASNKSFAGKWQHVNKRGEVTAVEVFTSLFQFNNKTCRVAVIVDLTKQNEQQQPIITDEVQQQLLLLQSAINNSADGIIITKNSSTDFYNSEIVYSNAAFNHLTGYAAQEIVGQKPALLHKKYPVKEASAVNHFQPETFETRLINYKNNKSDYWVDYSISPVEDGQGNITHFVAVYRDVSARKSREAENENFVRELQESNNELKQFSYVISHNLRAPLANLTGLLSLLDTEAIKDEDTLELIEAVKSSTNKLNITVNDIIDILMIKSEDDKIAQPLVIAEVWGKAKASLAYLIETANAQIEEDFAEAPVILFKESYLESILLNFLSNALKYRSDERRLVINIKTYQEQGHAVLIFEDNGIGIDLNRYGQQLFGLYKRFSNKAEGKGLGLYIVQAQITALGGKIEVKSELNKGTRFTVYFKNK
ncbi:ATP-binding response regulator [Mucilaginibacter arboris]|uniref:histidine kinase n=1 Tax=Mucilaginibacter arboris TaxID=2682090 RepID=A0A7K1SRZ3_9SPHI|nr:hybrid sensor histidine kinase/response regulator [Mucilaginibacter arboris]MVN20082.1 PAS domain S-box protein [Mucilaginibacter arboris]